MTASNEMLDIAIVVTAKITATTFVSGFARYAATRGHNIYIFADSLEPEQIEVGKGRISYVPITMCRDPHPIKDLRSLLELTTELRRNRPKVLLYATPKASLLASIAGTALGIRTRVYQLWGLRLETVTGTTRRILAACEKITSKFSTKILANSVSLSATYQSLGLNVGKRVDVLGQGSSHGVDIVRYSRVSSYPTLDEKTSEFLNRNKSRFIVGFVGRLHPDKGIDTLLAAVNQVQASGTPVAVLIVGNDEGANFERDLYWEDSSIIVGHVDDPRPYYAAMDVLVLPSLREGFPNVVLEAAAMSVPSIVSNGTGLVDSVVDGETGLIVPVQDSKILADAITRLATDAQQLSKLSAAARIRVEEHFIQELVWDKTLAYAIQSTLE